MGRYYALNDGEHAEVCEALREQYLPHSPATTACYEDRHGGGHRRTSSTRSPASYATGQKPTGPRDPSACAVRRSACCVLDRAAKLGTWTCSR